MAWGNRAEGLLVNNFVWALIQRKYILPLWLQSMRIEPNAVILEVGCGRGAGAVMVSEALKPSLFVGFDVDEKQISKAKRYVRGEYDDRIFVYIGDVTAISSSDCQYDAVFDFFTLHHVDDWRKGVAEVSRVLKPGGYFAFAELFDSAIRNYVVQNILRYPKEGRLDRESLVRSLAENRLRLMENTKAMGGRGIVGVARKS
jgi:ubiquinone/menaquinone biosynthesis C-methylase UbiE